MSRTLVRAKIGGGFVEVPYCRCSHARQVHTPTDRTLCRGRCWGYGHAESSHAGPCTARCSCDGFKPRP